MSGLDRSHEHMQDEAATPCVEYTNASASQRITGATGLGNLPRALAAAIPHHTAAPTGAAEPSATAAEATAGAAGTGPSAAEATAGAADSGETAAEVTAGAAEATAGAAEATAGAAGLNAGSTAAVLATPWSSSGATPQQEWVFMDALAQLRSIMFEDIALLAPADLPAAGE